jgi:3-oxoadipate enol-lactonase
LRRLAPRVTAEGRWHRTSIRCRSKEPDVYYERGGRCDRGAPAILFLHGLGSCGDDFRPQLAAFAAEYRLLVVDLPGHGRSTLPRNRLTVEGMAVEVDRLLADLGEGAVHVVGVSLGGCVGLALALAAPARVRTLTLVNAFARLRPAGTAATLRMALRGVLLATAPMSAVAALVARSVFPRPEQKELRHAARTSLARTSRRGYVAAAAALTRFDVRASLARVRCPTMVVAGTDDRTVAIDAKDTLAREIPGARWVVVPGSGHVTNADQPAVFNEMLKEFLATR